MLRWGIGLILIGILVALFISGSAGGELVSIGKWLVGAAILIWVVLLLLGGSLFRNTGGYNGPP